jgi:exopolysaccharide biosynthesis polyprenyl glycosylphosphotransferase
MKTMRPVLAVLVVMDLAAAFVAGTILAGGRMDGVGLNAEGGSIFYALPIALAFVGGLAGCGMYHVSTWFAPRRLAGRAVVAMLVLVAGTVVVAGIVGAEPPRPQSALLTIPALYVALAGALRAGLAVALGDRLVRPRLALICGAAPSEATRFNELQASLGIAAHEWPITLHDGDAPAIGRAARDLRHSGIRAAVALDPGAVTPALRGECAAAGVRVMSPQEFCELQQRKVDLDTLTDDWLDNAALSRSGAVSAAMRRGFDVLGSLVLLLATLPLLLLTALAIRLEGPGPIFYRQERVGLNGRTFRLFKFRSMRVDAEKDGPRWATLGDSRVTRVGRLIRLTRIDEIPQAINVLRGDMALIGPRPERPAFVEQLSSVIPHYGSRSAVRPGITGWAQINYPYGASVEDARNKLSYDLYYLRHRSLVLDLAIIFGTIRVILLQEGAR